MIPPPTLKFHRPDARMFVPDDAAEPLGRITHLGIGAHQDDLEFMAFHGILACYKSASEWFGGVTCTDGSGSSRTGPFAHYTDDEMRAIRMREQDEAASLGRYGVMIQLGHPSAAVKDSRDTSLKDDLKQILAATRPRIVYTHNPADKHDTHIGVVTAALQAMRELPAVARPETVHGCEGWRGLDWMPDDEKISLDVTDSENLAAPLNALFRSQIAGGKRYDLAILGRRRANATFFKSHSADQAEMVSLAMDLTPLVKDPSLPIVDHVLGYIEKFRNDVRAKLEKRLGTK